MFISEVGLAASGGGGRPLFMLYWFITQWGRPSLLPLYPVMTYKCQIPQVLVM